jgi:hypothetical protein
MHQCQVPKKMQIPQERPAQTLNQPYQRTHTFSQERTSLRPTQRTSKPSSLCRTRPRKQTPTRCMLRRTQTRNRWRRQRRRRQRGKTTQNSPQPRRQLRTRRPDRRASLRTARDQLHNLKQHPHILSKAIQCQPQTLLGKKLRPRRQASCTRPAKNHTPTRPHSPSPDLRTRPARNPLLLTSSPSPDLRTRPARNPLLLTSSPSPDLRTRLPTRHLLYSTSRPSSTQASTRPSSNQRRTRPRAKSPPRCIPRCQRQQ